MRILESLTMFKDNRKFKRFVNMLKMNTAIVRLVEGMMTALLITHLFACFWFLIAKFDVNE